MVIVTIVLRTSYTGFGRGFLAELLSILGLVSVTALACNFHGVLSQWVSPWWHFSSTVTAEFLTFIVVLLAGIVVARVLIRKLTDVIKWESLHWSVQGLGLVLGCIRGLWVSGLLVLLLLSTGLGYFYQAVEQRSLLAPHLLTVARHSFEQVADWYPGSPNRQELIPPARSQASSPSPSP